MSMTHQIYVFKKNNLPEIEKLITFVSKNFFEHQHVPAVLKRFFTNFVSSTEMIMEVLDPVTQELQAVAVLLDKVQNSQNTASLEILAISKYLKKEATQELIDLIIKETKIILPEHREGFEISFTDNHKPEENILKKHNLNFNYDVYKMAHTLLPNFIQDFIDEKIPENFVIMEANNNRLSEVYELLCQSFRNNKEVSIPEKQLWINNRQNETNEIIYVVLSGSKKVAFSHLIFQENNEFAEINSLGVLPEFRGYNLGKKLILYSLEKIAERNINECRLTVALENEKALALYSKCGFKIKQKSSVFQYKKK